MFARTVISHIRQDPGTRGITGRVLVSVMIGFVTGCTDGVAPYQRQSPPLTVRLAESLAANYDVIRLGSLGGSSSSVSGINNAGDVVGLSQLAGDQTFHATLWPAYSSVAVDLIPLPGDARSNATGINESGVVVGYSQGWIGDLPRFTAVVWFPSDYTPRSLSRSEAGSFFANAINDAGNIVGFKRVGSEVEHAVFWSRWDASPVDLPYIAIDHSIALDVNNGGEVVGYTGISSDFFHATKWSRLGSPEDLGTLNPSDTYSYAMSINQRGDAVGISKPAVGKVHATIWPAGGGNYDLGSLGGTYSAAVDINERGDAVGSSWDSNGVSWATLWPKGGEASNLGFQGVAQTINAKSDIAGVAAIDGTTVSVLLRHIHPE
jgi:uncharacterized membrane protein